MLQVSSGEADCAGNKTTVLYACIKNRKNRAKTGKPLAGRKNKKTDVT
jgi:hypothetical protein